MEFLKLWLGITSIILLIIIAGILGLSGIAYVGHQIPDPILQEFFLLGVGALVTGFLFAVFKRNI